MAEELQHLIDRIQKEAVDTAEKQSEQLIAQAKQKAAAMVSPPTKPMVISQFFHQSSCREASRRVCQYPPTAKGRAKPRATSRIRAAPRRLPGAAVGARQPGSQRSRISQAFAARCFVLELSTEPGALPMPIRLRL